MISKIKILVLNINDLGGIERVAINLLKMFSEEVYINDVEIVSVHGDGGKYKFLEGKNENLKLKKFIETLDDNTIVLSLYDRFSIKLSILKHFFGYKFKLYACQHADYFAHKVHTRFLRKISYLWVDKIIVLTKKDTDIYKKFFSNVYTIPNVLSFYPDRVKDINIRDIECAVAGRLVPIKQYDHFVFFLSKIHEHDKKYRIYGDGEEFRTLDNLLKDASLESSSILAGKSNDIEKELSNTKFFFVTSLRESFSMVILEAMACGCIVISYDCPTGPSELIEHGENGFLIDLNDKTKLVECYESIMSNPDKCEYISNNARIFAKNFLQSKVISQWKSVFNEH